MKEPSDHGLNDGSAVVNSKYRQSFRIVSRRVLLDGICHFAVDAPLIARKIEGGQFIIVRPDVRSERIPLSVCGWDRNKGTVEIIVSAVGKTTRQICDMMPGDAFQDVVGPLGEPSILPRSTGTCVLIGGGYGTGAIVPIATNLRGAGNKVIAIIGARTENTILMEAELDKICNEVIVTTNDGSRGVHGFVTDALSQVLEEESVIHVLAIGPVPMMKAVSEMTRQFKIPTFVSLNTIMVDGTGMCGACRVTVGKETKFACFHGPEFDGHLVDFDSMMKRQKMFAHEEAIANLTHPTPV